MCWAQNTTKLPHTNEYIARMSKDLFSFRLPQAHLSRNHIFLKVIFKRTDLPPIGQDSPARFFQTFGNHADKRSALALFFGAGTGGRREFKVEGRI